MGTRRRIPTSALQHPLRLSLLLSFVFVWLSPALAQTPFPMTGTIIPSLQPIDQLVTNFMAKYSVPGGAVGFVKDGKLVYVRGFGYANTDTLELAQPDSLFRIASLSKSVTAMAVLKLAEQGRLNLDQPAFSLLNYPPPTYPTASVDPRLGSITIRHLLNHTGGWNRDTATNPDGGIGFDPTVNWTVRAAADMGTTAPADATTVVRWMMGKPLQFDPGTQYQYSNFGYTVLGRIIEKITGTNYEEFVKSLLATVNISRMRIGGSRQVDKFPGEVTYYDYPGSTLTTSIFPQDTGPVPWPYNFSYSTMDAHGGWVASVIDLLRFVTAIDGWPTHTNLLSPASIATMTARPSPPWGPTDEPYYGMGWLVRNTPGNWWHDGSLPGTRTEMVRAGNGFTWAILFNTRVQQDSAFYADMDNLGWQALSAVSSWPTNDLFDAVLSYDCWKAKNFTSIELLTASISGDAADPDGDGLINLGEYAMGLQPRTRDATVAPSVAIQELNSQSFLTITFRRLLLNEELSYQLEISQDMVHWRSGCQQVGDPVLNADGTETVTYRSDTPTAQTGNTFLRLSIQRQPQ
jgi:CubicO group peptidase (beta-lactamase class C family)